MVGHLRFLLEAVGPELRQYIAKETGLPNSFGLSINKTVSKVATNTAKPNGQREVERGTEKPFLAPMSIEAIPGVGGKTAHLLGWRTAEG